MQYEIIQSNEIRNAFEDSQYVAVKNDDFVALHTSYRRGGCLYLGTVTLRDRHSNEVVEFEVTSRASATEAHALYLLGLAAKHLRGESAVDRMKADREARRTAEYEARLAAARRGDLGPEAREVVEKTELVGKDFIVEWKDETPSYGRVVSVEGDDVTWTPVFDPRHGNEFSTLSVATVKAALEETEAYDRFIGEQAEAEIRAETSIPQHLVW